EAADRGRKTVAAEPPERFLRAVGEEDEAERDANDQVGPRPVGSEDETDEIFHRSSPPRCDGPGHIVSSGREARVAHRPPVAASVLQLDMGAARAPVTPRRPRRAAG